MSKRQLLPSQPQLSFLLKQVSEDLQESDNESLCVSTYDDNQGEREIFWSFLMQEKKAAKQLQFIMCFLAKI